MQRLMTQATQLRREYHVQTGLQRAPFFEIHNESFAFIAGDTGILRRFDDRQWAWCEAALERAQGKFTMVLLGHLLCLPADRHKGRAIHPSAGSMTCSGSTRSPW